MNTQDLCKCSLQYLTKGISDDETDIQENEFIQI